MTAGSLSERRVGPHNFDSVGILPSSGPGEFVSQFFQLSKSRHVARAFDGLRGMLAAPSRQAKTIGAAMHSAYLIDWKRFSELDGSSDAYPSRAGWHPDIKSVQ
ncbi:hypothetical protein [Mesorhizobium sp. CN2-181]|uniref:hypothetical protein n=1 Tax=Mesorhizobium yinganensis TaxID=3157707 RepID=UPI0032B7CBF8